MAVHALLFAIIVACRVSMSSWADRSARSAERLELSEMGIRPCMKPRIDEGRPILRVRTVPAVPLRIGTMTVTPIVRSLVAGRKDVDLVWSRPHSVLVSQEGRTSRTRIFNLTRAVQVTIVAAAVLGAFWIRARSSGPKEMS